MVGLRLIEGVRLNDLGTRTGVNWVNIIQAKPLDTLVNEGLITRTGDHITATLNGRLQLNGILGFLV